MKKVRTIVNIVLGALITALGLTNCENRLKYGPDPEVLYGPPPEDTVVQCKYGVNPDIQKVPMPQEEVVPNEEVND